jgi:hypothetical protein
VEPTKQLVFALLVAVALVLAGLGVSSASAAQPAYTKDDPPPLGLEGLRLTDSVSQYGVTWTFDKPVRVGQFLNGDWYVVGPVTVKAIAPRPLIGEEAAADPEWTIQRTEDEDGRTVEEAVAPDPRERRECGGEAPRLSDQERAALKAEPAYCRNGSVLNPPPVMGKSGFDSRAPFQLYDPALTAVPPIEMKPGDALLSCISMKKLRRRGHYTPVDDLAVLTCLEAPVPADAFRPGYMDREQVIYLARDLKRHLLPRLEPVDDVPEVEWLAERLRKPWYVLNVFKGDHGSYQWGGYGQRSTFYLSQCYLYLCLDYPKEQKEPVLQAVVGLGIDLWGVVKSGHPGWPAWGGWNSGYKMPIVLAGYLLGDERMASPSRAYPKVSFQEDEQTAYGPCWNGANVVFTGHSGYDAANLQSRDRIRGGSLWGFYEHLHPSLWHRDQVQSDGYRRCCTSRTWPGQALAARLMHLEGYWAHDAYFDYVDRWMYQEETDTFKITSEQGFVRVGWDPLKDWSRQGQVEDPFAEAMWRKYRQTLDAPIDGWKTRKPNPGGLVMPEVRIPGGLQ